MIVAFMGFMNGSVTAKKRYSRRRGPGGEVYSQTADAAAFRRFDLRDEFSDTEAMLEPQNPSF